MVFTFFKQTGNGYVTSNALAIAMASALSGQKTVVLDLNFEPWQAGQNAFFQQNHEVKELKYYDNVGIDSLIRNIYSKTISRENIDNIATEIEKNLFYIPKTVKQRYELFVDDLTKTIVPMIKSLAMYYDLVIIDAGYGIAEINHEILEESDLMIANLTQNLEVLKRYVELFDFDKIVYLIGNYCEYSRFSSKKLRSEIKKHYKKNISITYVEHLQEFSDAIQSGRLIEFFYRNENVTGEDYNYSFFNSVKKAFKYLEKEYEKKGRMI